MIKRIKKHYFLMSLATCLTIVSLIIFAKTLFDDDDSTSDSLYVGECLGYYQDLFGNLSKVVIARNSDEYPSFPHASIIAYLAAREKSPPQSFLV